MKKREIGERFQYEGIWLEAIEEITSGRCTGCCRNLDPIVDCAGINCEGIILKETKINSSDHLLHPVTSKRKPRELELIGATVLGTKGWVSPDLKNKIERLIHMAGTPWNTVKHETIQVREVIKDD